MIRSLAAAAVLSLAASSASAFILTDADGYGAGSGGPYDVSTASAFTFNVSYFDAADPGGTYSFDFVNSGAIDTILDVTTFVLQSGIDFGTGVTVALTGGPSVSFAPGEDGDKMISYRLLAGDSTTLTLDIGDSVLESGQRAGIGLISLNVVASPVPVPAAGGLLLAALGAVALTRRRAA